ncbi:MAG: glycine cleavage system protein GcvH [Planctomycetes bacterium]|nr:glycine cleavage system protein GcvH [Planctomycetota bacterium]
MRPKDVKYTESHEWVRMEGNEAVVGITDFAVAQLSDLVHIDLPQAGDAVEQDAPFGEVESVKAVSDLISPLSGKVVAINEELPANLDLLAKDPFDEGWLVRVRVDDAAELEHLLSAAQYEEFLEAEQEEEEEEDEDEEDDE